jgi:AraC-like DNA-binding protein
MTKLVFDSLANAERSFALLDLIQDTHAWAKSYEGVFVYGNTLFYQRFGISSLQGLVGKNDYDLSPDHLAQKYLADDAKVLTGCNVIDRLEMIRGNDEGVDWFLTSKWPIYNPDNTVIGSLGISRHLNREARKFTPYHELNDPIEYIESNFAAPISVDQIARQCNLSVSALERRFKKHLKKTPHQYLNEVRLEHARGMLLETQKPIATIGMETGFSDHSHFTRSFTRYFGQAPSHFRKNQNR